MNQFIILIVLVATFSKAEEEPFSIGLGVLSPSYSQTVGKENVKVKFDQRDNGQFSFSVGDPKTGNNQYLSFGPSAGQQQASPAGYAASAPSTGYQASGLASGYQGPSLSTGYQASPLAAAYKASSYGNSYGYGPASAYNAPSGFYSGHGAGAGQASDYYGDSAARKPESGSSGILPAGFSYHATEGQAFLRQGGELRENQGNPAQVMPAGFSYHATDGQSFLRQGETPNFAIADDKQSSGHDSAEHTSGRGPAEQSFHRNFQTNKKVLVNGLVGYGPGGPARGLPIGGYAGAEFQGAHEEHGGHTE